MADTLVSAETPATALTSTDKFYVDQSAGDFYATPLLMRDYVAANLPANASTASQSPAASATTYLVGSTLTIPAGRLVAGSQCYWRVYLSKTAAGTVALQFQVKVGTLGTTSDTTAYTIAFGVGTAAIDAGYVDIEWNVIAGGATATSTGIAQMTKRLTTTGLTTVSSPDIQVGSQTSTVNATTATKIGLAIVVGASYVLTVQRVTASSLNL